MLRFGVGTLRFAMFRLGDSSFRSFRFRDALFCVASVWRPSVSLRFGLGRSVSLGRSNGSDIAIAIPIAIAFAFAIAIANDEQALDDRQSESSRFLDEDVGSKSHCLLHSETIVRNKEYNCL